MVGLHPRPLPSTRRTSALHAWSFILFGSLQVYCLTHLLARHIGYPRPTFGPSMLPTLNVSGDCVWVNKHYRRGRDVKVGDIVSFKHPLYSGETASKRVLGMPGDYVMRNSPGSGSDEMLQVPEGHCWVAGDNAPHSRDSREYGPLPLALVLGKVTWRIWPLGQVGRLGRTMEVVGRDRGFLKNG